MTVVEKGLRLNGGWSHNIVVLFCSDSSVEQLQCPTSLQVSKSIGFREWCWNGTPRNYACATEVWVLLIPKDIWFKNIFPKRSWFGQARALWHKRENYIIHIVCSSDRSSEEDPKGCLSNLRRLFTQEWKRTESPWLSGERAKAFVVLVRVRSD